MKLFVIQATGFLYEGLFASSSDAVIDALERFGPNVRVSVRPA